MKPKTPADVDADAKLLGMYYDVPLVLSALALTSSPFDLAEFDEVVDDNVYGEEVDSYLHLKAKQQSIVAYGWDEDDDPMDETDREKRLKASGEGVEGPEDENHVHEVDLEELKFLEMLFLVKPYMETLAIRESYNVRSLLL